MAARKFPKRSKEEERYNRYLQASLEVDKIEWEDDDFTPSMEERESSSTVIKTEEKVSNRLMPLSETRLSWNTATDYRKNLFGRCTRVCRKNMVSPFSLLFDEIILNIFSYLPRSTLMTCVEVCKRWKKLGYDQSLWRIVNLDSKHFTTEGQLGAILHRGVTTLRLSKAEVIAPICFEDCPNAKDNIDCGFSLVSLDCSMSHFKEDQLSSLLYNCKKLQNISLEGCKVNQAILGAISLNKNLEILNLALAVGLNHSSIELITRQCQNLRSLNISWTNQTRDIIRSLCKCKQLTALNLSGLRGGVNRNLMEMLVKNCIKLECLDLSDVALQIGSLKLIADNLTSLRNLSISRCTDVRSEQLYDLIDLKSLSQINLFGFLNMVALERFSDSRPDIHINKEVYSPIARPISSTTYEGKLWEQYVGFII